MLTATPHRQAIAAQAVEDDVIAEVLPDEKAAVVEGLRRGCPAWWATASTTPLATPPGIAIGTGTDATGAR